jgi:hypothetical protein
VRATYSFGLDSRMVRTITLEVVAPSLFVRQPSNDWRLRRTAVVNRNLLFNGPDPPIYLVARSRRPVIRCHCSRFIGLHFSVL